jgi:hypothetical protein
VLAVVVLITDAGMVIEDARRAVIAGVIWNPNMIMWGLIATSQT